MNPIPIIVLMTMLQGIPSPGPGTAAPHSGSSGPYPWSGIIAPSRAIDWTQAGVAGGIPTISTPCGSTIAAYGTSGSYASPSTINSAITACTSGDFVSLGTGDFYLNGGIDWAGKSGVVVRGQGAVSTRLHFSNIASCGGLGAVACIRDSSPVYQDSTAVQPGQSQAASWTAGYTVGATSLTIASVGSAGIANGQWIFLDQNLQEVFCTLAEVSTTVTATCAGGLPNNFVNGATLRLFGATNTGYDTVSATIANANQSAGTFQYTAGTSGMGADSAAAAVDNGSLVVCEVYQLCGYAGATSASGGIGRNVNGSRRQIWQAVKVTAGCATPCTGAGPFTITISPGLYLAANSAMNPGIWWPTGQVTGDGLENMLIDQTNNTGGNSGTGGIVFYDAFECWTQGVAERDAWLNHVWLFQSAQNTIQNSYFYGTQSGGGIESYGVESYLANNNLVQNNIFQQVSAPWIAGPTEGSVIAYNYALNDPSGASTIMSAMNWVTHDVDHFSLFEGNIGPQGRSDSTFANGDFNTHFRNQYLGADYADGQAKTGYTYPVGLEFWNRFYNLIANVLGTSGYHHEYECSTNAGCTDSDTSIYVFGYSGAGEQSCANPTYCPPDAQVADTVMRWGNYDVVNAAVRWVSGEVPSGISNFPNPVPSSHTLPASFYITSGTPSWWVFPSGSIAPFPGIGPDVTGGNQANVGGYAWENPAMNCYKNVMGGPSNGTGSALSFTCTY